MPKSVASPTGRGSPNPSTSFRLKAPHANSAMATRVPAHATAGYTLHRPPLPLIYKPPSCGVAPPGCDVERCMQKRDLRQAKHNASAVLALCARCECALCMICAKPRNRWSSPLGQTLESVTTNTDPPFTFAYNPNDADMQRMREQLVLEPVLTHAWHEATWRCCARPGGLVVDVGGNFGWYTLFSLALGCEVVVFEPVPLFQEVRPPPGHLYEPPYEPPYAAASPMLRPRCPGHLAPPGYLVITRAGAPAGHLPQPWLRRARDHLWQRRVRRAWQLQPARAAPRRQAQEEARYV